MEELRVEFHTAQEQAEILAHIENVDHKVITLLMMDCGLRVSEVRSMLWEKCDFQRKTITVRTSKKRDKIKYRTIPMPERLYVAFDQLIHERQKKSQPLKGFLFPNKAGTEPITRGAVNIALKRLEAKAPQVGKMRPHKLRHTAATNLVGNGANIVEVRDFLGHSDSRMTDIYTHANVEELRTLINASTPRPTLLERWTARLFPTRRSLINLIVPDTDFIFGRDKELRRLQELVSKDISVVITGAVGIGKTHLLQSLNLEKKTFVIDDVKDFKAAIKSALISVCTDKDELNFMLFNTSDLQASEKKMSSLSLPNLVQTLIDATQKKAYIIKINSIDEITPTVARAIEKLNEHFTIVTTARSIKLANSSFVWSWEKIELQPLPRQESLKVIYRMIGDCEIKDFDAVATKIFETSTGNPRKLRELSERLRKEPFINLESATDVSDSYIGKQSEEFDFSIILLLILGGFVLIRYFGRVTGDKDLQFIGAIIMLVAMFARYFFRSAKRRVI